MTWQQRLLAEAKIIVEHTDGELNFIARPIGKDEVKVIIKAGKSYSFIIRDTEE